MVQVFLDCPGHKLVEKDHALTVPICLLEQSLEVTFNSPGLKSGRGLLELLEGDPAVVVLVDLVKGHPVFVVLPQVHEKISELGSGDVVIPVLAFSLQLVLGSLVSPHEHWLQVEQVGQVQHIPHSLVNFGQAQVAIVVDIEALPDLGALCSFVGGGQVREFLLELCPHLL